MSDKLQFVVVRQFQHAKRANLVASHRQTEVCRTSAVNFPKHDIDRSDYRDDIRYHRPARHVWQRREIYKTRTAEMNARRFWPAGRFDVNTQLAFRRFNRLVYFARRNI